MKREKIRELFQKGQVALVCGEWVGLQKPAGFARRDEVSDDILLWLAGDGEEGRVSSLEDLVEDTPPIKKNLLPEIVVGEMALWKEGSLQALRENWEGDPNENHRLIARLAKGGRVSVIVDASWESYLERALQEVASEVEIHILREEREFAELLLKLKRGEPLKGVYLLKIFGDLHSLYLWKERRFFWNRKLSGVRSDLMTLITDRYYLAFWGWENMYWWEDEMGELMEKEEPSAKGVIWSLFPQERPNWEGETLRAIYGEERWAIVENDFANLLREVLGEEKKDSEEILDEDWLGDRENKVLNAFYEWGEEHLTERERDFLLAQILLKSGEKEIAVGYLEKIEKDLGKEKREWRWDCLHALGEGYLSLQKNKKAEKAFRKILQEAEEKPAEGEKERAIQRGARLKAGYLDYLEKDWEKGVDLCKKILREKPSGELCFEEFDFLFAMGVKLFEEAKAAGPALFEKFLKEEGFVLARTAWERRPFYLWEEKKVDYLWKLGSLYLQEEEGAKDFFDELQEDENKKISFIGKLGTMVLLWREGKREEGLGILEDLLEEKTEPLKVRVDLIDLQRSLMERGGWTSFFPSAMKTFDEMAKDLMAQGKEKAWRMCCWIRGHHHLINKEEEQALKWSGKGMAVALIKGAWDDYAYCSSLAIEVWARREDFEKIWELNLAVIESWRSHSEEMGDPILLNLASLFFHSKRERDFVSAIEWINRVCQKPKERMVWVENITDNMDIFRKIPHLLHQVSSVFHRWAKEMGHRSLESYISIEMARNYLELGRLSQVEKLIREQTPLWQQMEREEVILGLYTALGTRYFEEQKLKQGRKNMKKAWKWSEGSISDRLDALLLWGKLEMGYGSISEGERLLNDAVTWCTSCPHRLHHGENLRRLGVIWIDLARYEKAEEIFERAWECLNRAESECEDQEELEDIQIEKGFHLQWQGQIAIELTNVRKGLLKWTQAQNLFQKLGYSKLVQEMEKAIRAVQEKEKREASRYPLPGRKLLSGASSSKTQVGPNDPCPCGSGKKYKKCCEE